MTKRVVRQVRDNDDGAAKAIVQELRLDLSIERINFVKHAIKELRASVQQDAVEPRSRDLKKTIVKLANCARALASGIENIPSLRSQLSLYLSAGHSESKMTEWLGDLKNIADMLEFWRKLHAEIRPYPKSDPKLGCAIWAHSIIDRLSPTTRLTKGDDSKFYLVASWLWWAAVGEEKQNTKRVCDDYLDHLRGKKPNIKGTIIQGMPDLKA